MTAGEYCNREVVITEKNSSAADAAILMRQHHVGDLVVVEKLQDKTLPVGIITDRDLVIEVLAQKVDPDALSVQDIMCPTLLTVNEQETLLDTLELMKKKGVRRIIVVDEQGCLQGLLTADDTVELIAEAMNNLTSLVKQEITREAKNRP